MHGPINIRNNILFGYPKIQDSATEVARSWVLSLAVVLQETRHPLFCEKGLTATWSYTELREADYSTNTTLWHVERRQFQPQEGLRSMEDILLLKAFAICKTELFCCFNSKIGILWVAPFFFKKIGATLIVIPRLTSDPANEFFRLTKIYFRCFFGLG